MTLSDTALDYAARGVPVLPLHPSKKTPASRHGKDDATTDTDQVRAWWEHNPHYNIGLRPPVGFIVLDVDPRNGGDLDQLGTVPPTSIAKTGGGGWHLWFHYLGPVRGALDGTPGVDIKSNSGYLVAPPSIHDETGDEYRWISTGAIAPLPRHLVSRVARPRPQQRHTPPGCVGSGSVAGLVRSVAAAPTGSRNSILFWAACRLVESDSPPEHYTALCDAAVGNGLTQREAVSTIRSAQDQYRKANPS